MNEKEREKKEKKRERECVLIVTVHPTVCCVCMYVDGPKG